MGSSWKFCTHFFLLHSIYMSCQSLLHLTLPWYSNCQLLNMVYSELYYLWKKFILPALSGINTAVSNIKYLNNTRWNL
jgi:hypothetical protein